jgi:hypothetical protein
MVLVVMTMALYVVYELNVSQDASYMQTPTAVKSSKARPMLGLLITVAILLMIYLLVFGFTLFKNFLYIREQTSSNRTIFLFNLLMLIITVFTLIFGVYQPFYANGQAFVFFIALMNLYVWALLYVHWPMGWDANFTGAPSRSIVNSSRMT